MSPEQVGLVGGLAGGCIGLLGGVLGSWASIRNTKTPAARAYMVRVTAWAWLSITAFLGLLLVLPGAYRWLAWLPYMLVLPWAIQRTNRKLADLEQRDVK